MVFIDALESCSADSATATKTFSHGGLGAAGDCVSESALIECMAQTVAALHGYQARNANAAPRIGKLVGLTDVAFENPAACGEPLEISVTVTHRVGDFCVAAGEVKQGERVVAAGGLKFHVGEAPNP